MAHIGPLHLRIQYYVDDVLGRRKIVWPSSLKLDLDHWKLLRKSFSRILWELSPKSRFTTECEIQSKIMGWFAWLQLFSDWAGDAFSSMSVMFWGNLRLCELKLEPLQILGQLVQVESGNSNYSTVWAPSCPWISSKSFPRWSCWTSSQRSRMNRVPAATWRVPRTGLIGREMWSSARNTSVRRTPSTGCRP